MTRFRHVTISGAVGKGGINRHRDVAEVQELLNTKLPVGMRSLRIDGDDGPLTAAAIEQVQKHFVGLSKPDGRVDPHGPTLRALNFARPRPHAAHPLAAPDTAPRHAAPPQRRATTSARPPLADRPSAADAASVGASGVPAGIVSAAQASRERDRPAPATPAVAAQQPPSAEAVIQRWTAEHQRQLAAVQAKGRRVMGHAEGMERRHAGTVEEHQRQRPMPPQGMFAAFKQASYDAAWKTWEKAADVLRRRAAQLGRRVDQLRDYLKPVTEYTPHHPGNRLAIERVEREQPDLAKAHAEVLRQQRLEQIVQVDRAAKAAWAERIAQFEKTERGAKPAEAERVAQESENIR